MASISETSTSEIPALDEQSPGDPIGNAIGRSLTIQTSPNEGAGVSLYMADISGSGGGTGGPALPGLPGAFLVNSNIGLVPDTIPNDSGGPFFTIPTDFSGDRVTAALKNLVFQAPDIPDGTDKLVALVGRADFVPSGSLTFGDQKPPLTNPITGERFPSFPYETLIVSHPAVTGSGISISVFGEPVHPFANVSIADNPDLQGGPQDSAQIIAPGGTLSGPGLTPIGSTGIAYRLDATSPSNLVNELKALTFSADTSSGGIRLLRFSLMVTNNVPQPLTSTNNDFAVVGFGGFNGTPSLVEPSPNGIEIVPLNDITSGDSLRFLQSNVQALSSSLPSDVQSALSLQSPPSLSDLGLGMLQHTGSTHAALNPAAGSASQFDTFVPLLNETTRTTSTNT
jgi:hypothetical protein